LVHIDKQGGMILDRVFYTGEITKEELFEELNELLNKYLRELYTQDKEKND
jgi:predicted site-specific integrase-resolvase